MSKRRTVRYSVAMSLDGYIAGPENEIDWIVIDPDFDFSPLMERFDALFMGRRSFEAMPSYEGGELPKMQTYVVSRTLRPDAVQGATLVDNLEEIITQIRTLPGKDIWLFGGGALFQSAINSGLVDTVEIAIIPILLGAGIPMLQSPAQKTRLRLTESRVLEKTGTVLLDYDVVCESDL